MIPFYRRKVMIMPMVIIVSFLAWRGCNFAVDNQHPGLEKTQELTDVADKVHAILLQNGLDFIVIRDEWAKSSVLQAETLDAIKKEIKSAGGNIDEAKFTYQCSDECYFTAYFYMDKPEPGVIGPYRYIQYNPDGHLEYISPSYQQNSLTEHLQYNGDGMIEEFVPSISEALKEDNGYVYFFCEPLEQEYWHYCQGQYD